MNHNQNLQASRKFLRGHSSSLHSTSGINICYWNDANTVCVVDNDFPAGNTDFVERLQGNVLRCPESIRLYQEIYGWVDKTNQQPSYYLTKNRSRRKQNHLLFTIIEIFALCNMHTVWRNIENLPFEQRNMSNADFRFLIINHYYSNFRMLNSGSEPAQPE